MGGEERRGTDNLESLTEVETLVGEVDEALDVEESSVTLIAMIDISLDAKLVEESYATHAEDNLLLEAVLPVTAIERVSESAILGIVEWVVSVKEIERDAAYVDAPNLQLNLTAREVDGDVELLSVGSADLVNREALELRGLIDGLLLAVDGEALLEISVTVEETNSGEVDTAVRSLLEVVASEDAETARVDLEDVGETILHAEVGDGGLVGERLVEVRLKLGIDAVEA